MQVLTLFKKDELIFLPAKNIKAGSIDVNRLFRHRKNSIF